MARGFPEHRWGPHSKGTPRDATSRSSMREPASSAAAAVHVVESGPDSSFQLETPAPPGCVLELAGGCPQIYPGFGWPTHPLRRSPCSGGSEGLVLSGLLGPPGTSRDGLVGSLPAAQAPLVGAQSGFLLFKGGRTAGA